MPRPGGSSFHKRAQERRREADEQRQRDLDQAIKTGDFGRIAVAVMRMELAEPSVGTKTIRLMPWTWGAESVDCIGFVTAVMSETFRHLNQESAARQAERLRSGSGMDLAKYLISSRGWHGIYWNPDVRNPADGDNEHPYSYSQMACKKKMYYGAPVSGHLVNYNADPPDGRGTAALQRLGEVNFAFGVARGAKHTFLVSQGTIYEAKWAAGAFTGNAYRAIPFEEYEWLSGLLVIPGHDGLGFPMTC